MTPRVSTSTALGVVAGLVLSLSVALIVVVAGNGANNPGMAPSGGESAAGGASAPLPRRSSEHSAFDGLDVDGKIAAIERQIANLDADRRGRALEDRRDAALKELEAAIAAIR